MLPAALVPRGFTLVELLVVIAIIALLASVAFPAVSGMINRGKDAKCTSNLKQLAQGIRLYAADNNGRIPVNPGGEEGGGWAGNIFPYLYPDGKKGEWGNKNPALSRSKFPVFYCPSAPTNDTVLNAGTYNYAYNMFLVPQGKATVNRLLNDRSDVIMIADSHAGLNDAGRGAPFGLVQAKGHLDKGGSERHSGRRDCFVFVDGHAECIPWPRYSTNQAIWDPNAPRK